MVRARHTEHILKYAAGLVLFAVAAFQVMALRGLYADGSFQLLNLLISENDSARPDLFHELVTYNNEPMRFFVYIITELPTVIALRLGITSLALLTWIFSSWLLLAPLLFWGLALWKTRKDFLFWAFLAMFGAVYFNGNFFIIGEYNLAYGLSACCLAYILKAKSNTWLDNAVLLFAAFASIMSYGSTLFIGPLLCALAIRQCILSPTSRAKWFWACLSLIFAASAVAGVWGYLHPRLPENLQNARNPRVLLHNPQFWFTLAYPLFVASHLFLRSKEWRSIQSYTLLGLGVVFLIAPFASSPYLDYQVRAFTAVVFFLFMIAICWSQIYARKYIRLKNLKGFYSLNHYVIPVFVMIAALSFADIQESFEFRAYIDDFKAKVNRHSGLLRFEDSAMLIKNNDLYGWTWTYPTMSVILRKDNTRAIVVQPQFQKGRWQPFDPLISVPDLSRYYSKS